MNANRLTLEDIQNIAQERGGRCLSSAYTNSRAKLLWECDKGHQWEATYRSIKRHWCPECALQKRRSSIEDMQEIAIKRGGRCLSDKYVNNSTKLLWECAEGHQWEAKPNNIKFGRWCPVCAVQAKKERIIKAKGTIPKRTLAEMQELATKQGGRCLSDKYIDSNTKLLWKCSNGHKWQMRPSDVKKGHWCPYCGKVAKGTIEDMQKIAEGQGGSCLSKEYINTSTKLLWECHQGHRWSASPRNVKSGKWCPYCAGKAKRTVEDMRRIAKERGGRFLSKTYINVDTKYLWECAEGHQWKTTPSEIERGRWCPECSSGLGERICREFFEQLFEKEFPKCYPEWLINQEGNQMELDGYNESLGIAFEHHGEHHYTTKSSFIRTHKALQKRQNDDKAKRDLCAQHGVILFEIPEIPARTPIKDVKECIKIQCNQYEVALPVNFDAKEIDLKNAYAVSDLRTKLAELQIIAKQRGGKCLSTTYTNNTTKLLWECAKGHQWKAVPKGIKKGYWCPKCARSKKARQPDIIEL